MMFQTFIFVVREAVPINLGDIADYNMMLEIHLTFALIAYPGWRDVIFTVSCYGLQTVVARYIFYSVEASYLQLVFKFIFTCVGQIISLFFVCVTINWIATKYIEAELAR